MNFDVYIYDSSCAPLKVSGIHVESFDSSNNRLLDSDATRQIGSPIEWGAKLNWNPVATPIEILFRDPNCNFSGHAFADINGKVAGRLDTILRQLPSSGGGQSSVPRRSLSSLAQWVSEAYNWSTTEKIASWTLIKNFVSFIVSRRELGTISTDLAVVAKNWEMALDRIEFRLGWLE